MLEFYQFFNAGEFLKKICWWEHSHLVVSSSSWGKKPAKVAEMQVSERHRKCHPSSNNMAVVFILSQIWHCYATFEKQDLKVNRAASVLAYEAKTVCSENPATRQTNPKFDMNASIKTQEGNHCGMLRSLEIFGFSTGKFVEEHILQIIS